MHGAIIKRSQIAFGGSGLQREIDLSIPYCTTRSFCWALYRRPMLKPDSDRLDVTASA